MRKFLSVMMMLSILMVALSACAPAAKPAAATQAAPAEPTKAPEQAPAASSGRVLKVGMNSENVPWEFMRDGKLVGFEVDMVEEIAKRLGATIEYKTVPFQTVLTGVQSGQWDMAASSIWVKKERMEAMDFADPYYDSAISLVTRKDGGIAKYEDMKDKVFGCDTGSANEQWLKDNQSKYGPYEIKNYDSPTDAFLDLQAGRIDGVVADAPTGLFYVAQNPDAGLDVPLQMSDVQFAQAMAFQKGSKLTAEVNKVQSEMKKDGAMAAIYEKWFGQKPPADSSAINDVKPYLPGEKPKAGGAAAPAPIAGAPKSIKVGMNSENVPWEFMRDGKLVGFEVDMVEEIAKRLGATIEYKTVPFQTVLTGVQSGQWDMAASSIWVKKERMEAMDFADPYYDSAISLVTRKDGGIAKYEDMKDKVFGCDTGSANEQWLKDNQSKYGPYEIKNYDSPTDAFLDLQAGRIDGVVADAPTGLFYVAQNPDAGLDVPLQMSDVQFAQALAFQKGSSLRDMVNTVQNEMKKDGAMAAIYEKWFGQKPPADSSAINDVKPYLPGEKP